MRVSRGGGGSASPADPASPPATSVPPEAEGTKGRAGYPPRSDTCQKKEGEERPPCGRGVVSREEREGMEKVGGRAGWPPSILDPIGHGDRSGEATVTSPARLNQVRVRFPVTVEQAGQNLSGSMKRN